MISEPLVESANGIICCFLHTEKIYELPIFEKFWTFGRNFSSWCADVHLARKLCLHWKPPHLKLCWVIPVTRILAFVACFSSDEKLFGTNWKRKVVENFMVVLVVGGSTYNGSILSNFHFFWENARFWTVLKRGHFWACFWDHKDLPTPPFYGPTLPCNFTVLQLPIILKSTPPVKLKIFLGPLVLEVESRRENYETRI